MTSKTLTDEQIQAMLDLGNQSEDGLDFSDDDSIQDPDFVADHEFISDEDEGENIADAEDDDAETEDLQDPQPGTSKTPQKNRKKTKGQNVTWKKKNLVLNNEQLSFLGDSNLPPELLELSTPLQFFLYLFPISLMELIKEETNIYTIQKNPTSTMVVSVLEIQQFIGILFYMSLIRISRVTKYWSKIGVAVIQETMSLNKFEKIRVNLHFNNTDNELPVTDENHDRLFKIRPIVSRLNANFSKVPLEQNICVDEQICSTKARNHMKRYNPKKPHKWGYKLNVLCGNSGFAYLIEADTGKENIVLPGEPDLGASSNIVMRLARIIPRHLNYRLHFDNYFTSLGLLEYLGKEGILSVGTVNRRRIPNCKHPEEKAMKKEPRGTFTEYVAHCDGVDISTTAWLDNKVVCMASTFAGALPIDTVRRYEKSKKRYITVNRPFVIAQYNKNMGGVDLIDSIMGRYKILVRSNRWQVRMFYHLLDLTMSNAWLLYRRVLKSTSGTSSQKPLNSFDFRLEIAETLCKMGKKSTKSRKRGSTVELELEKKKHRGPTQHVPPKPVRQDEIAHWCAWSDKRIRCKYPNCKGFTQVLCEKCGVGLCFNKKNNCFKKFHSE